MSCVEDSVMGSGMKSKRATLALVALGGLSGCLTVNNIPTKDEPALVPDGGGDRDTGTGSGGQEPDASPPLGEPCQDLPDVDYDGIPLKGVKDYCPGGFACDATRHCVPLEPCSPASAAACYLDELVADDSRAEALSYQFSAALDEQYVYGTSLGTFGSFDEYKKDGTIFRAKIGTWEREVLYSGLNVPTDLTLVGGSLFFRQQGEEPLALYGAPADGSLSPRLISGFTRAQPYGRFHGCKVLHGYAFCPLYLSDSKCEVARYELQPVQDASEFKRPVFSPSCPFLFVENDAIYAQTFSGYARLDPSSGTVTDLAVGLLEGGTELGVWNGQWFGAEPTGWLRVRDLDGNNRQRVGGLGSGIEVLFTIPELQSVLFAASDVSVAGVAVVPSVVGRIAVLASVDPSVGQRLVDLTVVGKNCRVSNVLGASRRGVLLWSEDLGTGRCGPDTKDHYLFRRF